MPLLFLLPLASLIFDEKLKLFFLVSVVPFLSDCFLNYFSYSLAFQKFDFEMSK